ncbi:MAG: hypothetical protein N3B01_08935 [Verrucomicrobiae bacterium]|nr:hypothetical protein [Verrucomicrobiae bacterium]
MMKRIGKRLATALMLTIVCTALALCYATCPEQDCHSDAAPAKSLHCELHCLCHNLFIPPTVAVPSPDTVAACKLLEKPPKFLLLIRSIFQPPRAG